MSGCPQNGTAVLNYSIAALAVRDQGRSGLAATGCDEDHLSLRTTNSERIMFRDFSWCVGVVVVVVVALLLLLLLVWCVVFVVASLFSWLDVCQHDLQFHGPNQFSLPFLQPCTYTMQYP